MATTRSFSAMLNQYLPNELLREEMVKRDWILQNVERDDSWLGGDLIVPFKGAQASSVAFGSLTASTDVAEDVFVRGSITTQPEVWFTMVFNHRDIMEHGKISEQNFLKLLPDTIEDGMDFMKQCVSLSFLNGAAFATLTATGDASGNLTVDRIERFVLNQKVFVYNSTTGLSAAGYVKTINMDTNIATLVTARGGSTPLDISAYTVALGSKVYFDGSQGQPLTSLKTSLLSATNGGSSTLYGQTKTTYPYLQAIQVSGAAWTGATILNDIFTGYTTVRVKGKGDPSTFLCSYKVLGLVMAALEQQKGAYHIQQGSSKVSAYGWNEITIVGVKGSLKVVAIQEMDDDWAAYLDMRSMKIFTNGFFRKRVNPDGREYFEVRATTGYSYLVDVCFFGDLVLLRPSYNGVVFTLAL